MASEAERRAALRERAYRIPQPTSAMQPMYTEALVVSCERLAVDPDAEISDDALYQAVVDACVEKMLKAYGEESGEFAREYFDGPHNEFMKRAAWGFPEKTPDLSKEPWWQRPFRKAGNG